MWFPEMFIVYADLLEWNHTFLDTQFLPFSHSI